MFFRNKPVSQYLKRIGKYDALAFRESWKNKGIPYKQLDLARTSLCIFNGRKPVIEFDVAVEMIKKINIAKQTILEVGCSSGYYSEVFKTSSLKLKYFGCDYSPEFIGLAKKVYPNVNFKLSDAAKLEYQSGQFDIVMLGSVLLHVVNWKKAVSEAYRVSKKYIFIHRHPVIHLFETQTFLKMGYGVKMFEIIFNEAEFLDFLYQKGLGVISIRSYQPHEIAGIDERVFTNSYLAVKLGK